MCSRAANPPDNRPTGATLVPVANGQALFAAAPDPKQIMLTPGDHDDGGFMYSQEYTAKLKAFLDSVLP